MPAHSAENPPAVKPYVMAKIASRGKELARPHNKKTDAVVSREEKVTMCVVGWVSVRCPRRIVEIRVEALSTEEVSGVFWEGI